MTQPLTLKELKKINPTMALVEQYKIDLAKKVNDGPFNIWAFLFATLYFIYIGAPWRFVIFFFLPWIFATFAGLFTEFGCAVMIGHLISHFIAGFVANPVAKKYKEKYIKEFSNVLPDAPVPFFAVSVSRLVFLGILSGGLYILYWSWRQWKSYKQATHSDVNTFLRAWFCHFTMPWLMARMTYSLKSKKSYVVYGVLFLIVTIINRVNDRVDRIFNNLGLEYNEDIMFINFLVGIISLIVLPLLLIPVQKAVNRFIKETFRQSLEENFYIGEIFFTLVGLVFVWIWPIASELNSRLQPEMSPIAVSSSASSPAAFTSETRMRKGFLSEFSADERRKIISRTFTLYRYTQIYPDLCAQAGYEMKQFPYIFEETFRESILQLQITLQKHNYTMDDVILQFATAIQNKMKPSAYEELDELRKSFAKERLARQEHIDEASLKEAIDTMYSIKDACYILDRDAKDMIGGGAFLEIF